MSPTVAITMIESGLGSILTGTVLYLVLSRGKQAYHYVFAAFLFICFIWDLGTCLLMIRNDHLNELPLIGMIAILPCIFIPALIFTFANLYTERPIKWALILVWVLTALTWVPIFMGLIYKIEGIYFYDWGNIFRVKPTILNYFIFIFWFGINLPAIWLLYRGMQREKSPVKHRHYVYIISGFLVVTFSVVKALVTMNINAAFLLPLGMFLNDILVAIIGLAIIKDQLFDITVIVKKGTIYSILAAILIFVYSFVEHILVTYVGEKVGENSTLLHLLAVGVGIAVLMPLKSRIERRIEGYFAHRSLQF
ncbi:MAG: hypothetical protein C3F13_13470 [Anaerolineales bacterium]|nr:MAG: hypothetical protein C3F13_13470 [Anaerolineales bacterium]